VIVFHSLKDGVDKLYYVNVESGQVSDFEGKIGGGEMDFAESTNAHLVEFSPDSTKIAYVAGPPPGGAGSGDTLKVRDVKSGQERAVYSDKGISSPSWSPDSQRILFIRKAGNTWALTQVDADGKNAKDIFTNKSGEQFRGGLSWSKLNMIAFAMNTTGASDVHVMFPDAKEIKNVTSHAADDSNPSWSPDGKMVLFTSTRDGSAQIYRVNADGSGLHRLSTPAGVDFSPSWSPDGNWVAFASTRNNATNIFIMDIYGANVKQVTFNGVDSRPIWTR
jgi:Tol biopolymer transport system component